MPRIDRFLGIVNKPSELNRPDGALDYALNVDVDDQGGLRLRLGDSSVASFTDIQAAYATRSGQRAFLIDDGSLKEIVDTDGTTVTLKTGLPDGEYYWAEAGNRVFFNGPAKGMIEEGVYKEWGIETPPQPYVTTRTGALPAGQYMVTCTYVDAYGREGGAATPFIIQLSETGGLAIALTALADHTTRVYVTSTNGRTWYFVEETGAAATVYDGSLLRQVVPLRDEQLGAGPPLLGQVIAFHDTRMFVSTFLPEKNLSALFYSIRGWYHLFRLDEDRKTIPGEIRLLISLDAGLLIGTDREIHLLTPEGLTEVPLADFGVPPGSSYGYDDQRRAVFWTEHGACRAMPFEQLTWDRAEVHAGLRAAGIIIDKDFQRFMAYLTHNEDPSTWNTTE